MAKPPFQFKQSKPSPKSDQKVALVGTSDVLASYADIFVVTNEGETGMSSIYFYQRQFSDREVVLGETEAKFRPPNAQCISRIIMSTPAIGALLEAMAKNRGFTLTPIKEEKK